MAVRVLNGAIRGACYAPVVVLVFVIAEGAVELVFHPSAITLESLWFLILVLLASAPAGAFIGASLELMPARTGLIVFLFPIAGSIAGGVFWLLRPEVSLAKSTLSGAGILVFLGVLGWMEDQASHSAPTPEGFDPRILNPVGSPFECPRCQQITRTTNFCEVCGKDLRSNLPPVVMPDS